MWLFVLFIMVFDNKIVWFIWVCMVFCLYEKIGFVNINIILFYIMYYYVSGYLYINER